MNSYGAPYWLENCRMSKFSGLPGRISEEIPIYVSLYHPSWLSSWPYYYLEGNKQKIANFKESWAPKNWCFWTLVLEKTLKSLLDCKEILPVHPKRNQSWIFIERTNAEAEAPYFGHLIRRTDSLERTLMLVKIESRRRRGRQSMRWLDGITDSMDMSLSKHCVLVDGHGSLACYSPWGYKESDVTEHLNNNNTECC